MTSYNPQSHSQSQQHQQQLSSSLLSNNRSNRSHSLTSSYKPNHHNNNTTLKRQSNNTNTGGLDDDDDDNNDIANNLISLDSTVTLISKQRTRHTCSKLCILQGELCRTLLEGDSSTNEIELSLIDNDTIDLIIKYCTYHINVPTRHIKQPLTKCNMYDIVDKFDSSFINSLSQTQLFQLLLASNYMNIKSLLQLCSAKIATLLYGKSTQQITHTFGINNSYTQLEENDIRKMYKELLE